jgi:hypothetical protein
VTPGKVAEVTPAREHARLVAEMQAMANLIEHSPVALIATPGVFEAAARLHDVLGVMGEAAARELALAADADSSS